ncbi:hypothetical protein [Bernardetia sp.]|uniref:hypothetical protein n=1 Tax=Bernardetia sp. TaxID=1937974 RepID=UPI0025C03BE9|nr:hypothetical protein [Bernardetia sp.]
MLGYILFAITLIVCVPVIITAYLDNKKLREENVYLDTDNVTVHRILNIQGYAKICKEYGIKPRMDIIDKMKKL